MCACVSSHEYLCIIWVQETEGLEEGVGTPKLAFQAAGSPRVGTENLNHPTEPSLQSGFLCVVLADLELAVW